MNTQLSIDGKTTSDALQSAFEISWNRHTPQRHEMSFELGGQHVHLRCVGDQLHQLVTRPLAHLRTDAMTGITPRLTIDLWDELETGVDCDGCVIDDTLDINGEIVCSDGRHVVYRRARSKTAYDRQRGHMIGWSAYGDQACLYELGRPLHALLSYWHTDAGLQVMHAGLVAAPNDSVGAGVLFPGMGGSGKSTSALTCLEAGWWYLGDDYIGLAGDAQHGFVGHSVYNSSHIEPHHLERFAHLKSHAIPARNEQEDKYLVLLNDIYPGQFLCSVRIRAIAIPRITDKHESQWQPAKRSQALLALAPSSVVMIPGQHPKSLDRLAQLIQDTPCYWLYLGRDLQSIPRCAEQIITDATS